MNRQALLIAGVALAALASGFFLASRFAAPPAPPEPLNPETIVGEPRPPFTVGSATGEQVSAGDFDGRVLLVNFWATWCAPCVEEMPMLDEVHRAYADEGLAIVGVALDDVARARAFADELGISYPVLLGATDVMALSRAYGNLSGQLPYTVLVGRDGRVAWTLLGALERDELERRIESLL